MPGGVSINPGRTETGKNTMLGFSDEAFIDISLDSLPDAFYILSVPEGGRLIRWNRVFNEVTGYSDEDLSRMTVLDFFDDADRKRRQEEFFLRLLADGSGTLEIDITDKHGTRIPFEFHSTLVKDAATGEPVAVVGTGRDVTGRVDAEARYQEAVSSLRERVKESRCLFSLSRLGQSRDTGLEDMFRNAVALIPPAWQYPDITSAEIAFDGAVYRSGDWDAVASCMSANVSVEGRIRGTVRVAYREERPEGFEGPFLREKRFLIEAIAETLATIVEAHEVRARLENSEGKYRELAESLPQVVFELDMTGKVLYINDNAYRMFGYEREDFFDGFNALQVFDESDHERIAGAWLKMADGRSDGAIREYLAKRKDGSTFPARAYTALISGKNGERLGIRGLLTDITEERRMADELRKANKELEGYSHTVSHDLKGPLTSILMAQELLATLIQREAPDLTDRFADVTRILARSTNRAIGLVNNLLVLAEAGKPAKTSLVDLDEKLREFMLDNQGELDAKGIKIETDHLGTVRANPTHVYQVFSNILRNSLRHIDSGNGLIEVRRLRDNEYLIRDNGPGIPEDIIDDVFVPFVKDDEGDTGLGLSIVKKIVETYGGTIRAYNDGGACFEFELKDFEPG